MNKRNNRPKPILSMWMPEYSDDNRPWYDIKTIEKPELTSEQISELKKKIDAINRRMKKGDYQFALDMASENGLYDFVDEILTTIEDPDLQIGSALHLAGKNGHEDIALLLLHHDFKNEYSVMWIARPLNKYDILYAIRQSVKGGYAEIAIMIQKYYMEMYDEKNDLV